VNFDAAADYAARHALEALRIERDGAVAYERYGPAFDADKPHALYSGTKSFWGIAAVAAEEDSILRLDEPVGDTFAAWAQGSKALVSLRMLLSLTSGIGFGGLGNAVPSYERALAVPLKHEPGTTFTYGGIPLQVFGAVLAHKLRARSLSAHAYLHERILGPLGLRVGSWRTLRDGTQPLPTGAFVAAREWAKLGRLVLEEGTWQGTPLVSKRSLRTCFEGSQANPRYGLTWWLSPLASAPDVVYASGSGGQALYILPSARTVVVKFGHSSSFSHEAFLRRLLS